MLSLVSSSFIMDSFYVTLPSFGDGNTIGTYTQKLAEVIRLPGAWEVGLAEIIYPASWINVTEANRRLYLCYDEKYFYDREMEGIRDWSCGQDTRDDYDMPIGYYTKERMGDTLNFMIDAFLGKDDNNKTKKYFSLKHGVMKFKGTDQGVKMTVHRDIADIMGFEQNVFCQLMTQATVMPVAQPHSLYLYTNIIEPQLVGPTKAQLLAVIPAGERNQLSTRYATNPIQYFSLRYDQLETIEINIRDSKGDAIPFTSGHSVVKLHIRPKQR